MCNDYIHNNAANSTYSKIEEVKKKIASDMKYSHGEIPLNQDAEFYH